MGLLDRWRVARAASTFEAPAGPGFVIDADSVPPEIFGLTSYATAITPEARLSRSEALQNDVVKRSRDLICSTSGMLPLITLSSDYERGTRPLLDQPEADVPRSVSMARVVEDLVLEGVSWWRVVDTDFTGRPTKVVRLDVRSVDVQKDGKVYVRRDGSSQGIRTEWVPDEQLIRFDSPTDGVLIAGSRVIRQALKLDAAATRYADAPQPLGFFAPRDPQSDIGDENTVADMLDDWETARRTRSTGYVPGAVVYQAVQYSPVDLQLTEQRQHAALKVANLFGVDPDYVGANPSGAGETYANVQDRRRDLIDFTLAPYLAAIQDRLSMNDVTPAGYVVRFDTSAFLRSNEAERMSVYAQALAIGAYDLDEVLRREELPRTAAAPAAASPPVRPLRAVPAQPNEGAPVSAAAAVGSTFDAVPAHFGFETDEGRLGFEVDRTKRTIYGLAVPFGVEARKGGRRFVFARGTLKWGDASRVKLLVQHDRAQAVGRAVELTEDEAGLWARFQVARTPEGDRALAMAEDGVWDGLSIGLGDDARFDKRGGAWHSVDAPLQEISLTPNPAFDDARVSAVAAEADDPEGPAMTGTTTGTETTTPAEAPAPTFDADAVAERLFARLSESGQSDERPAVRAGRPLAVREEPVYRFDGRPGAHDFSTDLFRSLRFNDGDAGARIERFMNELSFDIATDDVNEANPTIQRPDLAVRSLEFQYPVWSAIQKGTLTEITPFTFPKISSAGTLVADHVEGTAPTAGTFVTTGQTVTPTASSGRVEITREVVDQGGNPQITEWIWSEIVMAWYEALEVGAVAMLDALTPTAIALNGTDADLDQDIKANLSALAYIRGGNRFRDLVVASNLHGALVGATDDTGRPLYPVVAPANASGTTEPFFQQVMVGGLAAKPAWALESGNGGDGSSYLFNRGDVHGWATPPRRFTFEYRVEYVDLAVWGYKAFANSRLAGVREVTYSAV